MSELRVGTPFASPELTIVPIETVCRDLHIEKSGFYLSAFKEPVAVVILRNLEIHALDVAGREMDPSELTSHVAGLSQLLDRLLKFP